MNLRSRFPNATGIACALFLCLSPSNVYALTLSSGEVFDAIFAGDNTTYEITLSGEPHSSVTLDWKLAALNRVLSSGQNVVRFREEGMQTILLQLDTPSVNSGISIQTELFVQATNNATPEDVSESTFRIRLYGQDIFLPEQAYFNAINIQLFDPSGSTQLALDELHIPYHDLTSLGLDTASKKGLILIGEGLKLDQTRGLTDELIHMARSGFTILILRPESGSISLSALSDNSDNPPSSFALLDAGVLTKFSNQAQWIKETQPKNLMLNSYRSEMVVDVSENQQSNWKWFEYTYQNSGGKLILNSLPFLPYLEKSPIVQETFGRLLIHSSNSSSTMPASTKEN